MRLLVFPPLGYKRCLCHFAKWHLLISKETISRHNQLMGRQRRVDVFERNGGFDLQAPGCEMTTIYKPNKNRDVPLDTRRCINAESASVTLIQRWYNVVCAVLPTRCGKLKFAIQWRCIFGDTSLCNNRAQSLDKVPNFGQTCCENPKTVTVYFSSKQLRVFRLYFAEQNCRAPNNWHCVTYKSYGRWCNIRWELVISGRTRDMRLGDTPPHPTPFTHCPTPTPIPLGKLRRLHSPQRSARPKGGNCLLEE